MVGGFASIVQTQITDTYNLVRADKKLFRFEAKKRITEAKEYSDQLIAAFKHHMKETDLYQFWLDITDSLEEDLRPDVQKCFFALDNQFLKHDIKEHILFTNVLMADTLCSMLQRAIGRFADMMREMNGVLVFNLAERFLEPIKGVRSRMRNAMEILYPAKIDNEVFADCAGQFDLGFDVIGLKVLDYERANKAVEKAVELSGLNLSYDDNEPSTHFDNTGTPWNDAQNRSLKIAYADTPNKDIADIVGRSVSEVIKQAKKLGLKKDPAYLRNIRTQNLKSKKTS